jgi:hypothetical protein
MIEVFDELKTFIGRNCSVKASFGLRDITPDEYPHVQIIPNSDFSISHLAAWDVSLSLSVTLKIIVDRKAEHEALSILMRLLDKLREFKQKEGDTFGDGGTMTYEENIFSISIPYRLRYIP